MQSEKTHNITGMTGCKKSDFKRKEDDKSLEQQQPEVAKVHNGGNTSDIDFDKELCICVEELI